MVYWIWIPVSFILGGLAYFIAIGLCSMNKDGGSNDSCSFCCIDNDNLTSFSIDGFE